MITTLKLIIHLTDLLQGSDEVDEAARHSAHNVAGVAVLGQQERQLQHEVLLKPHLIQFQFKINVKRAHSLPGTRSTGLKKCVGFDIPLVMLQGLGIMVGPVRTPNKMVHISSYFSGAHFENIKS